MLGVPEFGLIANLFLGRLSQGFGNKDMGVWRRHLWLRVNLPTLTYLLNTTPDISTPEEEIQHHATLRPLYPDFGCRW